MIRDDQCFCRVTEARRATKANTRLFIPTIIAFCQLLYQIQKAVSDLVSPPRHQSVWQVGWPGTTVHAACAKYLCASHRIQPLHNIASISNFCPQIRLRRPRTGCLATLSLVFLVAFKSRHLDFTHGSFLCPPEWITNANRRRRAPWLTMRSVPRKGAGCPRATTTLLYVTLTPALEITCLGMASCLGACCPPQTILPTCSGQRQFFLHPRPRTDSSLSFGTTHNSIPRVANIRPCRTSQRAKRPRRRPPSVSNSSSKSVEPPTRGAFPRHGR